jgi:hypothetical protein
MLVAGAQVVAVAVGAAVEASTCSPRSPSSLRLIAIRQTAFDRSEVPRGIPIPVDMPEWQPRAAPKRPAAV